jgi:hypothetical protein
MDLRKFRRASVEYPVSFVSEGLNGKGVTYNLSTKGCGVRSDTPAAQGTYMALQIRLPGNPAPMSIEMAVVRWSRQTEFGADFVTMSEAEQERLRRTLGALERDDPSLPGHPA